MFLSSLVPAAAVLVELFTSEGCSSCPPADAALERLVRTQPVAGVEIIPLALHVDYWNRLGWEDPFSSAEFSARQNAYARAFGSDRIYTPQLVVDGLSELVGGDDSRARSAIEAAAKRARAFVNVSAVPAGGAVRVHVAVRDVPRVTPGDTAEVLLAITEDRLRTDVARGENAGRKLPHSAVVRRLTSLGTARPGAASDLEETVELPRAWNREALHAVAFVQERGSRRVLGAARVLVPFR